MECRRIRRLTTRSGTKRLAHTAGTRPCRASFVPGSNATFSRLASASRSSLFRTLKSDICVTIHIHKACFDGVVSGALVSWWIAERGIGAFPPRVAPVDYGDAATWLGHPLGPEDSVVDFLYHPDAATWWDHHVNPFRRAAWRKEYVVIASSFVRWDPEAKSCAGLIARCLSAEDFEIPAHLCRTVQWAELVDSASYPTPEDAVVRQSAARRIALSLAVDDSISYHQELVDSLLSSDVEGVVERSPVREAVAKAAVWYERGIERMREGATREGNIIVYRVESIDSISDRLVAFYLYRDADYSLGIVRRGAETKVTANANPWQSPDGPDLGRIFARHGGGGHHGVGSVVIPGSDSTRAERVLREVLDALQVSAVR